MKDITISVRRQKTEIKYLLISLMFAIGLNILGILIYKTEWKELYTQLRMVIALTVTIYILLAIFRFLISKLMKIFKK